MDDELRALRDALAATPDNVPLRRVVAQALLRAGHVVEAESEFKEVLRRSADDLDAKLGLAWAYKRLGKVAGAMFLVDDLINMSPRPAPAHLLRAHLLLGSGEAAGAVEAYRAALRADPASTDAALEERLGMPAAGRVGDDGEVVEGRVRARAGPLADDDDGSEADLERPEIRFDDVGGMAQLKEEIRLKVIHPLQHPELYRAYGKRIGGGILLYGPPGCGKTHIARATAGEVGASFLAVGIHDVLDMWIGASERNLHALFEQARRHAPSVLFFDEVDALGARRSDMRTSGGRHLINQFLAELDGAERSNDGVLVLAATNAPWHVDPAFRRPGRFDRVIFVPPPDLAAREAILRILCRGRPLGRVDLRKVAQRTDRFSGADLKAVVEHAVERKLAAAIRSGRTEPIEADDLLAATRTIKPTTREWFATARNYVLYANQDGFLDEVRAHLEEG